jgi:parallel beta-helix repeat protein
VNQAPASGLCLTKAKSGSSVTGNTFTNCGGAAKGTDGFTLILDGGSTGTTMSSNTLKGCKGGGIYVKEASRNTVSKNTIAVAGGKKIINLYNASNSTVTGNTGGSNAVAIGGNCSGNKIS